MTTPDEIEAAIFADEIGIASARFGDAILRSAFQIVYAVRGDALEAVAAESFLRPAIDGIPVSPRRFLAELCEEDRVVARDVALALHCRNYAHLDLEDLAHVIAIGRGEHVPVRLPDEGGERICRVREPLQLSPEELDDLVSAARGEGMRLAFSGVGFDQAILDRVREHVPEVVGLDGGWFRRVSASDGARLLLARLIHGLKEQGAMVLVSGIEAQSQLRAAIDAGADLLQGYALSRPSPAGAEMGPARIPLATAGAHDGKIIPLFMAIRA